MLTNPKDTTMSYPLHCFACGKNIGKDYMPWTTFREREDWKEAFEECNGKSAVPGPSLVLKAAEIEDMCFKKNPAVWKVFYRASQLSILSQYQYSNDC